jgi:hypothetical protein
VDKAWVAMTGLPKAEREERRWRLLRLLIHSGRELPAHRRPVQLLPLGSLGRVRHIKVDNTVLGGVLQAAGVVASEAKFKEERPEVGFLRA